MCGYDVCGRALCSLRVIARSPSAMLYSLAIMAKKDTDEEEDSEEWNAFSGFMWVSGFTARDEIIV